MAETLVQLQNADPAMTELAFGDIQVPNTVAELLAEEPVALTSLSVGMSTGATEDYD